ncbi:MAG: permease [Chloroflexota bacterium]
MKIGKKFKLDNSLLVLFALVALAAVTAGVQGGWPLIAGALGQGVQLFQSVWLYFILGLILGGQVQKLVPSQLIATWMGQASGMKGILVGSGLSMVLPLGPYVFLPIIAGIYEAGAGAGPVIALLAGRSLIGLQTIVTWQIPFLGVGIPMARFLAGVLLPPFIGILGRVIFQLMKPAAPGELELPGKDLGTAE